MSDSADDEFATLKPSLRRVIDTAFLKLSRRAKSTHGPLRKKPRLEDPESDEEGGFVKDDQDEQVSEDEQTSIPLSMVPTGLQMLDLPPDDEDVMNVFRNAATGWESRTGVPRRRGSESDEEVSVDKDAGLSVSREDWRAVCAVLLGQKEEEEEEEDNEEEEEPPKKRMKKSVRKTERKQPERRVTRGQTRTATKQATPKKIIEAEDSDEGGGFLVEDEEGGGFVPGSDDEQAGFLPPSDEEMENAQDGSDSDRYSDDDASSVSEFGAPTRPKPTRSRTKKDELDVDVDAGLDDDWENDMPRSLTVRQLKEAKLAFALFFPSVDANDSSLNTRRLGTKEVEEAAKALKENLSSSDIIEMLNMFSSAPDGSIGLEEFGRMAVMARLI
ncbi:hypothetical protein RSOLAG22IIIB_08459 [Rhizoctonia solani]|uniref:EF-hand domain-containing protein n=1 Tax=Rhizoctonia solani TaxID=456999 RepID=A0A0K6FTI0_9AGAM|nr:hypothetical protein RSOLAG22IIIB_08459 [Rhizoctonia solani]